MIEFKLEGKIVPKARPRVGNGRGYLPSNYREWKNDAIVQLFSQHQMSRLIEKCQIEIEIGGKQRGDLDNIAGSVLDALVQAGVLVDDRLSVVSKLTIEHFPDRKFGASIKIV
jgi:Holliday junction resolvase RusA-like endonuclease